MNTEPESKGAQNEHPKPEPSTALEVLDVERGLAA